jgi:hypothetical protein
MVNTRFADAVRPFGAQPELSRQPRQQLRHDSRRPLADAARGADAARAEPGRDKPVGCEGRLPLSSAMMPANRPLGASAHA